MSVGNICHVRLAVEREHVVLAQREHVYVLYYYHLVVVLLEECVGEHLVRVLAVTSCQYLHGLGHPHRCLLQSFPFRVLAQQSENVVIVFSELLQPVSEFCFRVHVLLSVCVLR